MAHTPQTDPPHMSQSSQAAMMQHFQAEARAALMPRLQFDRTITFGLLMTIVIQTGGVLIWAGAAGARLSALEAQISQSPAISERLARLEGQTSQMAKSLARIEHELIKGDE